jgi:DNA-binding transcriptional regulator YdaS (Cro superfamily)
MDAVRRRKSWPDYAEQARLQAMQFSAEGCSELEQARKQIHTDPVRAELTVTDVMWKLERQQRILEQAKRDRAA